MGGAGRGLSGIGNIVGDGWGLGRTRQGLSTPVGLDLWEEMGGAHVLECYNH